KRDATVLNPLKRFFERVHNEPEHTAYFAKKIARDMADPLGNHNGRRFSIRHDREGASLRHREKRKVGWGGRTPGTRATAWIVGHRWASQSSALHCSPSLIDASMASCLP